MVNYKIQQTGRLVPLESANQPGTWPGYVYHGYDVVETQTGNVVASDLQQSQAKATCRRLNFGGGFDGWTPAFFLQKTKISNDENGFFV